jgi:transcriptional regulator with XRE-family HTH domain
MSRSNPTIRRRRLARALYRMRQEAGLTADAAAREAGVDKSTLLRWEAAESSVHPSAAAILFALYGADEAEVAALVQVAREARKRGWWLPWNSAIPPWLATYVGLESEAAEIKEFQPILIPGLLQTEGYAEAVIRAEHPDDSDGQVNTRIELRKQRQQREDDYVLWTIIGEAALYFPVGGSKVMRDQLEHLMAVARRPRCNIQVLPTTAGEHGSMGSGFIVLTFANPADPPVAYVESMAGSLYIEEEDGVRRFASLFQHLSATALSARESARLIAKAAESM